MQIREENIRDHTSTNPNLVGDLEEKVCWTDATIAPMKNSEAPMPKYFLPNARMMTLGGGGEALLGT